MGLRLKVTTTMFFLDDSLQEEEGGGKTARKACMRGFLLQLAKLYIIPWVSWIPVMSELCLWLRQWLIQVLFLTLAHTSVQLTWNQLPFFPYSEGHRCLLCKKHYGSACAYHTNFSICFQLGQKACYSDSIGQKKLR